MQAEQVALELAAALRERPWFFAELLRKYSRVDYRTFLLGWSELRTRHPLERDEEGRYRLRGE